MDRHLCRSRQWRLSRRTHLSTPVHYDLLEALCSHAQRVALVRLAGQYGDTVAMTQLLEAGVYFVTRARGYHVLEHPQIQGVLAHPPTASVTRVNSDEVFEVFDGGWLQLDTGVSQTRVIVARHHLPAPSKRVSVGKCIGEWVYELFITTLPIDRFPYTYHEEKRLPCDSNTNLHVP